jgi:hypothetical protein
MVSSQAVTARKIWLPTAILAAAAAFVCALLASRLEYVPIWDGRIYAACISSAAENLAPEALRCGGHASHAYVLVASLAQKIAPSSTVPVLVTNALLFLVAVIGFNRLVRHGFPEASAFDRALLTSAFALQPAFVASIVQPGLDLPLLPGFVWCVVFTIERRPVPLVFSGLWVAFTKETGLILYAVVVGCHALWLLAKWPRPASERIREVLRLAPLAVPGVAFVGYLALRKLTVPSQPPVWYGSTTGAPIIEQLLVPRLDLYQVNYAALILVLNFSWVPWGITIFDGFIGLVRAGHREPRREVTGADKSVAVFLLLVTLATAYALTRFTTYGHTRYFLPVYALALLPFYTALLRLGVMATARRAILASYACALALSSIRSVDPLSRRLYGTFPFGEHQLFRMTRVTGECCGFGQDQLVYNLEFTNIHPLTWHALTGAAAGPEPVIVIPDSANWIFLDPPDSGHLLEGRNWGRLNARLYEPRHLLRDSAAPDSALYLALPYGRNDRAIRALSASYEFRDEQRYTRAGYAISTFRMTKRRP